MKRLSVACIASSLLISLSFSTACTHSQEPEVRSETVEAAPAKVETTLQEDKAVVAADKKPNCTSESFCTREYRPTTCQFLGKDFASANPCEAKKLARAFACESGQTYDESKVSCKSSKALKQ